jgi:hypothetical protein
MDSVMTLIAWGLTTLIGAFAGSYLGAYMKKKGENRAIHEDINKLVDQVRAVTAATKQIEAEISSGVWDKQKRWEMKRDVLFETTKRIAALYDAVSQLQVVLRTQSADAALKASTVGQQMKIEENKTYFARKAALKESQFFVEVTCGKEIANAINAFDSLVTRVAAGINKDDTTIFDASSRQLTGLRDGVREAIRNELATGGVTSQFNESSAAANPAAPAHST